MGSCGAHGNVYVNEEPLKSSAQVQPCVYAELQRLSGGLAPQLLYPEIFVILPSDVEKPLLYSWIPLGLLMEAVRFRPAGVMPRSRPTEPTQRPHNNDHQASILISMLSIALTPEPSLRCNNSQHRRDISLPALHAIHHHRNDKHPDEHNNPPIKIRHICCRRVGPKAPKKRKRAIQQPEIDCASQPPAQPPACLGERVFTGEDPAEEHTADGDDVCGHQGDEEEGDDCVEGGVAEDVDEREEARENAAEGDGVHGDQEPGVHGAEVGGEGEAVVAREGEQLAGGGSCEAVGRS